MQMSYKTVWNMTEQELQSCLDPTLIKTYTLHCRMAVFSQHNIYARQQQQFLWLSVSFAWMGWIKFHLGRKKRIMKEKV